MPPEDRAGTIAFGGRADDTSPAARRLQFEMWRRMSPIEKLHIVTELTLTVQQLSLIGIQQRHPGASQRECLLRLAALKLGSDLTRRVYPEAAALADL